MKFVLGISCLKQNCARCLIPALLSALLFGGVVWAQTPQPYVYPLKKQSKQQQDKDRYECHSWAVEQTGFDPSRAYPSNPTQLDPQPVSTLSAARPARGGSRCRSRGGRGRDNWGCRERGGRRSRYGWACRWISQEGCTASASGTATGERSVGGGFSASKL
jgi:hypothetical protein